MSKVWTFVAFLAILFPSAGVASNHDERFWMPIKNVRYKFYIDAHKWNPVLIKPIKSHYVSFELTYVSEVYLYADETRSGAGGYIQCTYALNAALYAYYRYDDGSGVVRKIFDAPRIPPAAQIKTGEFCNSFEANPITISAINFKLSERYWENVISVNDTRDPHIIGSVLVVDKNINTAPLRNMALACYRTKNVACRYQVYKALAQMWLVQSSVVGSQEFNALSPTELQTLAKCVDEIGDNVSETKVLDTVVDGIKDILKDKASDQFPMLKLVEPFVKIITQGPSTGDINEDMQVKFTRESDEQLEADNDEADHMIASLQAAAKSTPNGDLGDKLRGSIAYFASVKKGVSAERSRRGAAIARGGGAASGGTTGSEKSPAGSHGTAAPGRGAEGRNTGSGPAAPDGTRGFARPDNVGSSFGGMIGGRPHDASGNGNSDDGSQDTQQGPVTVPGPH